MTQSQIPTLIEDEILKHLPNDAINQLAELSEDDDAHEAEIVEILKRNGIDLNVIAEHLAKKGIKNAQ